MLTQLLTMTTTQKFPSLLRPPQFEGLEDGRFTRPHRPVQAAEGLGALQVEPVEVPVVGGHGALRD